MNAIDSSQHCNEQTKRKQTCAVGFKQDLLHTCLLVGLLVFSLATYQCKLIEIYQLNGCRTNRDCSAQSICYFGTCTHTTAQAPFSLLSEITPPSNASQFTQQIPLKITDYRPRMVFKTTYPFQGRIEKSATDKTLLSGKILIEEDSLIKGHALLFPVNLSSEMTSTGKLIDGEFNASLKESTYRVYFFPNSTDTASPSRPPALLERTLNITRNRTPAPTYRYYLNTPLQIKGRIGASEDTPEIGYSNVRVYATVKGQILTSTSTFTNTKGEFTLYLAQGIHLIDLHFGPSLDDTINANRYFPDFTISDIKIGEIDTTLNPIYVGALASAVKLNLHLQAEDKNQPPIEHARIYAEASIYGIGTYKRGINFDTPTQAQGLYSLDLLRLGQNTPLSYTISVVPEKNSPYAETSFTYALQSGIPETLEVTLSKQRRPIEVCVKNYLHKPIAFSNITFSTHQYSHTHEILHNILTDQTGCNRLLLDDAAYELEINPPYGSQEPLFYTTFTVSEQSASTLTIELPKARLLAGEVTLEETTTLDTSFLKNSRIEFFQFGEEALELRSIGHAVVDEFGHYSVAIGENFIINNQ